MKKHTIFSSNAGALAQATVQSKGAAAPTGPGQSRHPPVLSVREHSNPQVHNSDCGTISGKRKAKERPILFIAPMVRAILTGSKTQTRRVVKIKHLPFIEALLAKFLEGKWDKRPAPYDHPGDRLWVREAFRFIKPFDKDSPSRVADLCLDAGYQKPWAPIQYEADSKRDNWTSVSSIYTKPEPGKLRPGIHLPRWASRIDLEITGLRVERLRDISDADCRAEGCHGGHGSIPGYGYNATPLEHYRHIWESINGAGSWDANPWVWVVEFRRL